MALPCVDGLICLIGTMVVWRAHLEVYDVSPGRTFLSLGELVVNAEGRGIEARF